MSSSDTPIGEKGNKNGNKILIDINNWEEGKRPDTEDGLWEDGQKHVPITNSITINLDPNTKSKKAIDETISTLTISFDSMLENIKKPGEFLKANVNLAKGNPEKYEKLKKALEKQKKARIEAKKKEEASRSEKDESAKDEK